MKLISIKVRCFKKRANGSLTPYFDANINLNSGLFLYDVYTLTIEHYRELLSSSPATFTLDVCVECDNDFIKGHTIIPSCI